MYRLLILIYLLLATPAWGAIALVAADGNNVVGGSSFVLTPTNGSGNIASVCVVFTDTTKSVSSITDDKGTAAYTFVDAKNNSTNVRVEQWKSTAMGGTSATITINLSSSTNAVGAVSTFSGVAAIGATATSASGHDTTATISEITQDADNWVTGCFGANSGGTHTTGTGNLRAAAQDTDNNLSTSSADNTTASPGSVTVAVTLTEVAFWSATAFELRSTSTLARRKPMEIIFQ